MRPCRVLAVDVGSIARGNFAWAAIDLTTPADRTPVDPPAVPAGVPTTADLAAAGLDPSSAVDALVDAHRTGAVLALGFESPLALPVPSTEAHPQAWKALGRGRTNEAGRAWSAGAGAQVLATGLVQSSWMLQRLHRLAGALRVTSDPTRWGGGEADLLLWEAFVSGVGKPVAVEGLNPHHADAAAAAATFAQRWLDGRLADSDITTAPHQSLNLAAAAALWAGHDLAADEVSKPVAVYRTAPATTVPAPTS